MADQQQQLALREEQPVIPAHSADAYMQDAPIVVKNGSDGYRRVFSAGFTPVGNAADAWIKSKARIGCIGIWRVSIAIFSINNGTISVWIVVIVLLLQLDLIQHGKTYILIE